MHLGKDMPTGPHCVEFNADNVSTKNNQPFLKSTPPLMVDSRGTTKFLRRKQLVWLAQLCIHEIV